MNCFQRDAGLTVLRSATEDQEQLPLLRMPGELRTSIYKYALGGQEITIRQHWKTCDCELRRIDCNVGPLSYTDHVVDIAGDEWGFSHNVSLVLAL